MKFAVDAAELECADDRPTRAESGEFVWGRARVVPCAELVGETPHELT